MFKPKLQQQQGFTLIEVLVAILLMTVFVAVAMQTMVLAAVFKARAREFTEATTWIQADLEDVYFKAANFQYTSLSAAAPSGALSINVASIDDFAIADKLKIGSDPGTYTIAVNGIIGTTITITPTLLGKPQLQGAEVVVTTRCNQAQTTGFADGLRDKITGTNQTTASNSVNISKTIVSTGKAFIMKRTTTLSSTAPYNVLQITYDVLPTSGGLSVANFYTEVIPNAALQCP